MAHHHNGESGFDDLTAYPILTDDISGSVGGDSSSTSASGGGAPIGKVVQNALRNVLAWKPRTGDPAAFVSALTQSFDLKTVEGHVEWKWNQRSYAIDADLGKVTGAQASIYARAKSFLDLVTPLIQGFNPLNPAFIQDDIDAIRAVVLNGVNELVNELGQEGGPRVSRVDQLFRLLLGPKGGQISSHATQPLGLDRDKLGGQLGLLRAKFGFDRHFVNTIPDEEMLTNFLILVDGVQGLLFTWTTQKKSFERRGNDVFLGTQAVLLSRSLGVIAESIQDACIVMDSVFLGVAERQVTELHLGPDRFGGDSSIFLGDLLSWIEDFATTEGPLLINEGGLLGVRETFVPTVEELERLTRRAAAIARSHSHNPTPNFHQPRVVVALETLANQIGECMSLSRDLRPNRPRILAVSPSSYADQTTVDLTVEGFNFEKHSTMRLERSTHPFDVIGPVPGVIGRGPVGPGPVPGSPGHNGPGPMGEPSNHRATITGTFDLTDNGAGYGESTWDVVITDPHGIDEVRPRFFKITKRGTPEVGIIVISHELVPGTPPTLNYTLQAEVINGSASNYSWSATSKAGGTATFTPNDIEGAESVTAALSSADTYEITVAVAVNGETKPVESPPMQIVVKQIPWDISVVVKSIQSSLGKIVTATNAEISFNDTATLQAAAQDQFGNAMQHQPHFHWTLSGEGGSIVTNAQGAAQCTYTAPGSGGGNAIINALVLLPGSSPLVSSTPVTINVS